MLYANTRTQARQIGTILNNIAGSKVVKQARTKTDKGWPIPWIKGTLKCPAKARPVSNKLPQRRRAKRVFLVGRDLLSAKEHSIANTPNLGHPQRNYGTMASLFTDAGLTAH